MPTGDISAALKNDMFALFRSYYANVSPEQFARDLGDKDFVIVLREDSILAGFTTVKLLRFWFEGQERLIVFSGDTIVARDHWGDQTLAIAWIRALAHVGQANPGMPSYWFLIVKGHRTFRYLPTFVHNFVPHWRGDAATALVRLRDALAADMFGDAYDPATGLIRFSEPHGNLAAPWAQPSARERARPDVAFFLDRNPNFAAGDELACLCEVTEENMRPLTKRLYHAALRG